jgi:hypothetical protein
MKIKLQTILLLLTVSFVWLAQPALAQTVTSGQRATSAVKTNSRILYNGGPVMVGATDVYVIWYGCWDETCRAGNTATKAIISDFIVTVGSSPYMQINTMYPNSYGQAPSGSVLFGGQSFDQYSHGLELTAADIQSIVSDQNYRQPSTSRSFWNLSRARVG